MSPSTPENLEKICWFVSEKMGFEDFGVRAVFGVRPLMGVPCPIWPLHVVALGALRKTNLSWGESPPIWGRYGGLKFCPKTYFGLDYDAVPTKRFSIFFALCKIRPSSSDSENLNKIAVLRFEKSSTKVGTQILDFENFRVLSSFNMVYR